MRILLIQNLAYVPAYGGANKTNRIILEKLVEKGHTCRVIASTTADTSADPRAALCRELAARNIEVLRSEPNKIVFNLNGVEIHALTDISQMRHEIKEQVADYDPTWLLVSAEDPAQILLETALNASPSRVVYICQTTLGLPFGPGCFIESKTRRDLISRSRAIITISDYLKDFLKKWGNLQSTVLKFPIYGEGPFPSYGNFDSGFVVMINPCAMKGIPIFLALARSLPHIQFAAVLTWGTTEEDRAALEQLPNIKLLSPVDDIDKIFAQSRILLMPSLWSEALGITAIEAMLRGIPTLTSNVGGLPEAKLGVDYVLPVRPIESYKQEFDNRRLPVPIVPDQDSTPWLEVLESLVSVRSHYERLSKKSTEAAIAHVSGLSIDPLEEFLENLSAASASNSAEDQPQGASSAAIQSGPLKRLDTLSPERRALLALKLKKKLAATAKHPVIEKRKQFDGVPASFAQQRLWFLDRMQPGSPVYNILAAAHLEGELEITALKRALQQIVNRHETLRTTFADTATGPVQIINRAFDLPLPVIDLSDAEDAQRDTLMRQLALDEGLNVFDLTKGPLVRASVIRMSPTRHVLLLNMHHMVSDGWSIGVFLKELTALYESFSKNTPCKLNEPAIQYADYAQWQEDDMRSAHIEKQFAYWKEQLSSTLPTLQLPTLKKTGAARSFRGARRPVTIRADLVSALKELGNSEEATPFMVLLAAFKILLSRYSGQQDIIVGTPIANRNRAETEELIGFFVNTLTLRTKVEGARSFREILRQVRDVAWAAYNNQDVPFEKLVEALQPERSLSNMPLFQTVFALQNNPMPAFEFAGLKLTPLKIDTGTAKFDLSFELEEKAALIEGALEYSCDVFDEATIDRMAGHFITLLESVVADPQQPVFALNMLTPYEREQLLNWNAGVADYSQVTSIHHLFEAQAERTPDAIALSMGDDLLTYRQMNQEANRLARYLRSFEVGAESLVAICMDRSAQLVVSLLGIIKSGAAFVPLDPASPNERLVTIVEDCGAKTLITHGALIDSHHLDGVRVIDIVQAWNRIKSQASDNLSVAIDPSNPAYVIYTSGSTGNPKGVVVTHSNVVRLFMATTQWFEFRSDDVWTMFHSYAFDFSVWEMWGALLYGGRLVMVPYIISRSPEAFYELLIKEGVTILNQTPSAFKQLMRADENADESESLALRRVIFGGEALDLSSLNEWFLRHGDQNPLLINMYGITETTVHVTYREINREDTKAGSVIGEAIPDLRLYVLNDHFEVAPVGIPGGIYVAGAGLARGYLNRPDLTAERFIANPYAKTRGERLYKTGDVARYLENGELQYLGRADNQVKIRGFRIELGEIETALIKHEAVSECHVFAHENEEGEKRLVAYLVAGKGKEIGQANIRGLLKERLPDYMIPSTFIVLDAMPLTPNGKLDRKALPSPELSRKESEQSYKAPETPLEEILAGIWSDVLQIDSVGVGDNFFDIGGHSLLAARLVASVRHVFGVELPLRVFFETPTVREIAAQIEWLLLADNKIEMPPMRTAPRDQEILLSYAQQRLWFLDQVEAGNPLYHCHHALELSGVPNLSALQQALGEVVRRHESLRTNFVINNGRPMQRIRSGASVALPLVDLSDFSSEEQAKELERLDGEQARQPFDLSRDLMLRAKLIKLAHEQHRLLFTVHHIACDGWSMGIVIEEMAALYEAFCQGKPSPLAELTIQYADYAMWQREWLESGVLESEIDYWVRQLEGAPPALELPTDYARPLAQRFRGDTQRFVLSEELTARLKDLSKSERVTLYMTLLAAFNVLLYRYSGQDQIAVGSPMAGRTLRETERLIGFFINTTVMRTDLSGDPCFRDLLGRVREVTLGAHAHQNMPFERLVEELQPKRDLSRNPIFQVWFVLQNTPMPPLELTDLTLRLLPTGSGVSKFDMALVMEEGESSIAGFWEYSTDLFDAATVAMMVERFQNLLENVTANPDVKLLDIQLTEEEAARAGVGLTGLSPDDFNAQFILGS